jgi:1,5-anhydro-D-fructose reductase (1,5-anhydro-D-mannitol-forming)
VTDETIEFSRMKTIRWGIIGCGDVTEVKSGPAFQKAVGSELVAVMRRDAAKATDYAKRHGVLRWYDDVDRLIADPQIDAVYVATPPGVHEINAMKVCAAGKPCYVEKPMARNAAEAGRMVRAFADANVPLFVAYYRRSLGRFVKAKEIIDSGRLGALRSIEYRYADGQMSKGETQTPWRLVAEQAGGGLFLDLGSHALDLLDWFFGPIGDVRGNAANVGGQYEVEDQVQLSFVTQGGVRGSASWKFNEGHPADEYRVVGVDGELKFACFGKEPVVVKYASRESESFDLPNPTHVEQPMIQTVVDELRGVEGKRSPSDGRSGLRTQIVMDCVLEGYYGGREDGFWRRKSSGTIPS